jgi:hypothetical protein
MCQTSDSKTGTLLEYRKSPLRDPKPFFRTGMEKMAGRSPSSDGMPIAKALDGIRISWDELSALGKNDARCA